MEGSCACTISYAPLSHVQVQEFTECSSGGMVGLLGSLVCTYITRGRIKTRYIKNRAIVTRSSNLRGGGLVARPHRAVGLKEEPRCLEIHLELIEDLQAPPCLVEAPELHERLERSACE